MVAASVETSDGDLVVTRECTEAVPHHQQKLGAGEEADRLMLDLRVKESLTQRMQAGSRC